MIKWIYETNNKTTDVDHLIIITHKNVLIVRQIVVNA